MNPQSEYELYLASLSYQEQIANLRQFFINMMDYTEQDDPMEIYILLEETIGKLKQ